MTMTLVRDNIPEITEDGPFGGPSIETADTTDEENYRTAFTKAKQLCELVDGLDIDQHEEIVNVILAEVKEVIDVMDRFSERAISKCQLKLKTQFGNYDRMVMMDVPDSDEDEGEEDWGAQ